jgi:antitoxin ParD1/3/4
LQGRVETRVKSGTYASASEVLRAAVRALDREEAAIDDWLKRQLEESLADPLPSVSTRTVFKKLRARHARRSKAKVRDL